MIDITTAELRMLIIEMAESISKMGGDPELQIKTIERLAELNAEFKARYKPN